MVMKEKSSPTVCVTPLTRAVSAVVAMLMGFIQYLQNGSGGDKKRDSSGMLKAHGNNVHDMAWHMAYGIWHSMAWHGMAWHGMAYGIWHMA